MFPNGSVLKISFLMIVGTLCFLLISLTLGAAFFKLPIDDYARLVGMLGIMGVFGGVVQAYIHANIADKGYTPIQPSKSTKVADIANPSANAGHCRVSLLILMLPLICLVGCASYNQKLICAQVATNNAAIPYVGGQSNGYVTACYFSCLGSSCPAPDNGSSLAKAVAAAIAQTNNSIITSGPVKVTVSPIK